MARITEQLVVIKLSKLVKDAADDENIVDDDMIGQLEAVVQELVPTAVVEVIKE